MRGGDLEKVCVSRQTADASKKRKIAVLLLITFLSSSSALFPFNFLFYPLLPSFPLAVVLLCSTSLAAVAAIQIIKFLYFNINNICECVCAWAVCNSIQFKLTK